MSCVLRSIFQRNCSGSALCRPSLHPASRRDPHPTSTGRWARLSYPTYPPGPLSWGEVSGSAGARAVWAVLGTKTRPVADVPDASGTPKKSTEAMDHAGAPLIIGNTQVSSDSRLDVGHDRVLCLRHPGRPRPSDAPKPASSGIWQCLLSSGRVSSGPSPSATRALQPDAVP